MEHTKSSFKEASSSLRATFLEQCSGKKHTSPRAEMLASSRTCSDRAAMDPMSLIKPNELPAQNR